MYSRLALLQHPAGARQMYQLDKVMLKLGPGGESYVPAPGLFPGGGDRSAWFIEKDGEKIGNFFLIREGRFLQSARLTGLTLHKPADVQNLLGPMLTESRRRTTAILSPLQSGTRKKTCAPPLMFTGSTMSGHGSVS